MLQLSVFVTPKLVATEAAEIGTYVSLARTIFEDWPRTAAGLRFRVHVPDTAGRDLCLEPLPDPGRQPQLPLAQRSLVWSRLFARVQALLNEEQSLTARLARFEDIRSYPVKDVHEILKNLYVDVARETALAVNRQRIRRQDSVADELQLENLLPDIQHLASDNSFGKLLPFQIHPPCDPPKPCAGQTQTNLQKTFDKAIEFLERKPEPPPTDAIPRTRPQEQLRDVPLDFHARVSQLGEYPALLRELTLVFNFLVPWRPEIGPQGLVFVLIEPTTGDPCQMDLSPLTPCKIKTNYILNQTSRLFASRPDSEEQLRNGLLRIDIPDKYLAMQVDVDSAALKAADFTRNLQEILQSEAADTPTTLAAPSLRSQGISIVKINRGADIPALLERSNNLLRAMERTCEIEVVAEELVRGYRIDVLVEGRSGPHWRSLCKRRVRFIDPELGLPPSEIEGWINPAISEQQLPESDRIRTYVHESICRWDGWSLVAPRPGRAVRDDSQTPQQPNPSLLNTDITPQPGSLPMLRFGYNYRLRARAVDLAGNDMSANSQLPADLSSTLPPSQLPPLKYLRYEPVNSPFLLPKSDLSQSLGETLDHLVLRSNFNTAPRTRPERHVAPPKTSQLMAELHGAFDAAGGGPPRRDRYEMITTHDGTFCSNNNTDDQQVFHNDFESSNLEIPYLPDPLSKGVALHGVPGTTGTYHIAFDGRWPDLKTFRISLVEGSGPPDWERSRRLLKIKLQKAQVARISISSHLDLQDQSRNDLSLLGMWQWAREANPAPSEQDAVAGRLWMLTPARELLLTHAVQQPLIEPTLPSLRVLPRNIGDTFADLQGEMLFHAHSTGKLDLVGEWNECIHDFIKEVPATRKGKAQVFERSITYEGADRLSFGTLAGAADRARHEFKDTKHRLVSYHGIATTRFLEQFVTQNADTVPAAQSQLPLTRETAVATRPVLNILSSARPEAPAVLYIVPMFGWTKPREYKDRSKTKHINRLRKGGGLRVYLAPPWCSSGEGEMLAAVVWPRAPLYVQGPEPRPGDKQSCEREDDLNQGPCAPISPIPEKIRPYTSQWGMDPLWASNTLQRALEVRDFINKEDFRTAAEPMTQFTIEELMPKVPGEYESHCLMEVAPFTPRYDEDRKLWYCDIQMVPTATYYPFVRLALARFQPNSVVERDAERRLIRDCHLSPIVLADFVQLTPTRSATITFVPKKDEIVAVTVKGFGYRDSSVGDRGSEVEVAVERRDKDAATGWNFVPGKVFRLRRIEPGADGTETSWTGEIDLGDDRKSGRFRLVIREYERFYADSSLQDRRVVYADALEL